MKKIKRIKMDVNDLSDPDLHGFGQKVKTKLDESTTFDPLDAKSVMLGQALGIYDTRIKSFDKKGKELEYDEVLVAQQRAEVINILHSLGAGVESLAEGELSVVLASGFDAQAPRARIGPLAAPQNLRVTMSSMEGSVVARWNKVRGARSYIVDCAPESGGPWKQVDVTTKVTLNINGLESGKKYRIRVRGVGAAGPGPWSDEAVKMAG